MAHPHPQSVPGFIHRPRNSMGASGLVLGLAGLVVSLIPPAGPAAWPLVVVGLALSALGMVRVARGAASNRGVTIAGVACSAAGLVVCILHTVVPGWPLPHLSHEVDRQQQKPQPPPSAVHAPPAPARTAVLTVTTGPRSNVQYSAGLQGDSEIIDAGRTWTKELRLGVSGAPLDLSVMPTTDDIEGEVSCRITIDGKLVYESAGGIAFCFGTF